ncbi:hypothetical protein D9M68_719600 [compost metagenome]
MLRGQTSYIAHPVERGANLEHARDIDGLALLQGFQLSQLLTIGFQQIGVAQQDAFPLRGRLVRPDAATECPMRRAHRTVNIGGSSFTDAGDDASRGRVEHGQGFGGARRPLAIDIATEFLSEKSANAGEKLNLGHVVNLVGRGRRKGRSRLASLWQSFFNNFHSTARNTTHSCQIYCGAYGTHEG